MTAKEIATAIGKLEYGQDPSAEIQKAAKESGCVIAYGWSDDCVELCGAIEDEISAYDGTDFLVSPNGDIVSEKCDECQKCGLFKSMLERTKKISALWCKGDVPWTFKTDIPHETFMVYEDGEPFCEAIVFNIKDI